MYLPSFECCWHYGNEHFRAIRVFMYRNLAPPHPPGRASLLSFFLLSQRYSLKYANMLNQRLVSWDQCAISDQSGHFGGRALRFCIATSPKHKQHEDGLCCICSPCNKHIHFVHSPYQHSTGTTLFFVNW
jgi:hypothetical protein